MMKLFHLSPAARHLIIFVLLIALLYQNKPIPGPDGLVEARIEYISNCGSWFPSKHITIEVQKRDLDKKWYTTQFEVEEVFVVSSTTVPRIGWLMKSLDYAPWLVEILPQRLTNRNEVYDVVVRITPEQWEQLEAAKHAGYKLSCRGGTCTY